MADRHTERLQATLATYLSTSHMPFADVLAEVPALRSVSQAKNLLTRLATTYGFAIVVEKDSAGRPGFRVAQLDWKQAESVANRLADRYPDIFEAEHVAAGPPDRCGG